MVPRACFNEATSSACASGHANACSFTHTWVDANPLQGMGDIFEGRRSLVTPLQGMGDVVAGMAVGG